MKELSTAHTTARNPSPSRPRRDTSPGGGGFAGRKSPRPSWSEFARQVKETVTPKEVAAAYGLDFDRNGFACCPIHGEKTPSFHITRDGRGKPQAFHCFGCGVSLDVIDFVGRMEGLDFEASVRKLNRDFGVGLPLDGPPFGEMLTYRQRRELERKQAERLMADRARRTEKAARAEWEALWDAVISELADCDRALRNLRLAHPKGQPVGEETARRLAELYARRAYAVYRYENLPDETEYVQSRATSS